jgi:hypothetical protein
MVEKWAHVYNEPTVAFAWWKQWARTIHNLAMINDRGLFRSGLPGTNNNSESLNSKDKVAFNHRRPVTVEFIENLMDEMWKRSVHDLQFTADILKSKVHSKKFYRSIHKIREKAKRNEATFLNVGFAFSGVPTGSTLVASNEFLYDKNELMLFISEDREEKGLPLSACYDATVCINFKKSKKYHQDYIHFLKRTDVYTESLDFDECINIAGRFHIIRPIEMETELDERAIGDFLGTLKQMGMKVESVAYIKAQGKKGLVSCHCPMYMKRTWCIHSCAMTMQNGIMKNYPPTMDPRSTMKPLTGATKKDSKGDPYNSHRT